MHELYEIIYNDLTKYILTNSKYSPYIKITKYKPNETSDFPLITCVEGRYTSSPTTLKYGDYLYDYNVMEINIFTQNKTIDGVKVSGMTIKDEIRNHIETYFKDVYKMNIQVTPNAPNVDDSIYRCVINVNCIVDTKFTDKLIIYPR